MGMSVLLSNFRCVKFDSKQIGKPSCLTNLRFDKKIGGLDSSTGSCIVVMGPKGSFSQLLLIRPDSPVC